MIQFDDKQGLHFLCAVVAMHGLIQQTGLDQFPLASQGVTDAAFAQADSMMEEFLSRSEKGTAA